MRTHRPALYSHAVFVFLVLVTTAIPSTAQPLGSAASALVRARQDLETTTRGCFEKGWGTRTAYTLMTFSEAAPRRQEFAAFHRQRTRELSACALAAGQASNRYRSAVDDVKAKLLISSKASAQMRLVAQALDGSSAAMEQFIRAVFPKVVRLEQRLSEFFALLDHVRPSSSSRPLEFPEDINGLENDIAHAMRVQTTAAAAYLEAMHILFPSSALRTRAVVTRILDVVVRATVEVMSADETAQARAFRQYITAISRAQAMAQSEAQAADTSRIPGVVANYIEMGTHFESVLSDMRWMVRAIDGKREGLTPDKLAIIRQEDEKVLFRMEAALERVEALAVRIDQDATECMRRKC